MKPPRVAEWLLQRLLDAASSEAISGDLAEEFAGRAKSQGTGRATWWYWRQVIASIATRRSPRRRHSEINREPNRPTPRAGLLDGFRQDLRFTWRTFARAPAFTAAAVLTLATGIGAATAIATAAHRALMQPRITPIAGGSW